MRLKRRGSSQIQLQGAYDRTDPLEKYVKFARELQRVPTANDLRLKSRQDPAFPNRKVFERFGSKLDLVREAIEHCRKTEGHIELIGLLEGYIPPEGAISAQPQPTPFEVGFVYLVRSGSFYKIGKTNAVGRREYELSIQLPERVKLVHEIRTDDPDGIESYWHRRFESKRKNGEWFSLNASDVAAFKRRKFM